MDSRECFRNVANALRKGDVLRTLDMNFVVDGSVRVVRRPTIVLLESPVESEHAKSIDPLFLLRVITDDGTIGYANASYGFVLSMRRLDGELAVSTTRNEGGDDEVQEA